MRSDRNPYFFLKNSKDAHVQKLLKDAETLSVSSIQALAVKPDFKKAMLFVAEFGQQQKSLHTAELLADLMSNGPNPTVTVPQEIWQYQGPTVFISTNTNSSIEVQHNSYFLKEQDKIFINHNWLRLQNSKEQMLAHSVFHSQGSFLQLNQLIKLQVEQKYGKSLI